MFYVEVQDTGIGLTEEQSKKIFTPFNQVNTDSKLPSNGVGLSICRQICIELKGNINVNSQKGVGSVFTFSMQVQTS